MNVRHSYEQKGGLCRVLSSTFSSEWPGTQSAQDLHGHSSVASLFECEFSYSYVGNGRILPTCTVANCDMQTQMNVNLCLDEDGMCNRSDYWDIPSDVAGMVHILYSFACVIGKR